MSPYIQHSTNQLLATLPIEDFERLTPYLERIVLKFGQIVYQSNEWIETAYFPEQAAISLVSRLSNHSSTEVGLVGNEGTIGLPIILGSNRSTHEAIVQIGGTALRLDAEILQKEFARGGALQQQLLRYTQARLSQLSQILVCQTHHAIEQRLARWLLCLEDRTNFSEFSLTQTSIAQMLGVRRASVTDAASILQKAELIRCRRGQIAILDRVELEARSCECYRLMALEFDRLLGIH
ncbi:MAG: Crp/Fnr family transcriptional regulator [Geitlerinemataceae cyanobacterium]